ncbi:MAG: hypothetical protein ACRCVT_02450 [Leadbetterella sp.]
MYRFTIFCMLFLLFECKKSKQDVLGSDGTIQKIDSIMIVDNLIDREIILRKKDSLHTLEYSSSYLGKCKDSNINFIYRGILSGFQSPHFNSEIILYSNEGKKLGKYYIESLDSPKLIDNELLFVGMYDCNQTTRISFKDSIPKEIFINCKKTNGGMIGGIYKFEEQK